MYDIERQAKDLDDERRIKLRQEHAKPVLDRLNRWLLAQRQKVPDGWATAKAIDYSLKRWDALIRYCEEGAVPIDNNRVENQIRLGHWDDPTGCLQVPCVVENEPPMS